MTSKFQRTIEDFACAHCGAAVVGDGYTNHCPQCLWSKHVDINPGDRANPCGGMLEPIRVIQKHNQFRIIHRCQSCGEERSVRSREEDSFDALLAVTSRR